MRDGTYSPDDLIALLERTRLPLAGTALPAAVDQAHLDALLARTVALTSALRTADVNETTRLAARLLLSDLATVTTHLRGDANALRESLAHAVAGLDAAAASTVDNGCGSERGEGPPSNEGRRS